MYIGIPQIIVLILYFCGLGMKLALDGKQYTSKHNFWLTLLVDAIMIGLLYWGGFFG